jgi:regulator of protease activity HflC (stomatin/prohibitin superfamily)
VKSTPRTVARAPDSARGDAILRAEGARSATVLKAEGEVTSALRGVSKAFTEHLPPVTAAVATPDGADPVVTRAAEDAAHAVAAAEAAVTDAAVPTGTRSIDDGATRALTHPVS